MSLTYRNGGYPVLCPTPVSTGMETPRLNKLLLELDRLRGDGLNRRTIILALIALDNTLNRQNSALPGRSTQVQAERDVLATEGSDASHATPGMG